MSVITIRGQLGSGAPEIGRLVAVKLGADYVDREIIAKVAKQLDTQTQDVAAKEVPPGSLMERIGEILESNYSVGVGYDASMVYAGAYMPVWKMSLDDSRYLSGLEHVIQDLAESPSIVIVGRGSQFILKDHPHALHVLVEAPFDVRLKRVMENQKLEETEAKKDIEHSDKSRREFIKRFFHADIEDPDNYDMVVNTGRFDYETAAKIIASTAAEIKGPATRKKRTRKTAVKTKEV